MRFATAELHDALRREPPLANVILGGTEIGDDFGCGRIKYRTAIEVIDIANALQNLSSDTSSERYDAKTLLVNEIYLWIWLDDDAISYLTSHYETVRDYYLDAATNGIAMLKYMKC